MIKIKNLQEIEIMKEGGKKLAEILEQLKKEVRPGVTTNELNRLAESLVFQYGGECSFKGYNVPDDANPNRVYPACLCTSINEVIVHAIPSGRVLEEGDILSIDIGMKYKGFHNDMATTVAIGKIEPQTHKLLEVTQKALEIGIEKIKPGNKIGDISRAVQKYVEGQGFGVVRELCGHGIGRDVHEDPEILNSVTPDKTMVDKVGYTDAGRIVMKEGMVLCVEPMVTVGDWHIKVAPDSFGFATKDGSLSAHFEHTIAVTKDGHSVLTQIQVF
jgi:methionyl aminopeptidase